MVYCAYCGKSFTRKEHLERHIPSHTNVKPHRCSACQLSFARRDLLQRHHSTYHEARDPMEPLPGGVPTVAGRTPIACQNCANAKTGCDKRVPCSRCAEKNLPCAARFARRSSKAAVRAAAASAAFQSSLAQQPSGLPQSVQVQGQPPQPGQPQTINPSFMEVDQTVTKTEPGKSPSMEAVIAVDSHIHCGSPKKDSPAHSHVSPADFPSPHTRVEGLEDFMQISGDFVAPDSHYDLLTWPDYHSLDLDMYSTMPLGRTDIAMPAFTELSDVSAASEPMTTSSSRGSIHTRGTSIMSSPDFDNPVKPGGLALAAPADSSIPEFEVVIAATGAWNFARCNPPMYTGTCPRTAIVHLECLEQKSKQEGTWNSLEKYLEQVDWDAVDLASVVPLTSRTRDKMLAITQSFLHKALEIHRGGSNGYPKAGYASPGDFNFIVLPPSQILEYFLRSYVRSLSVYFPLVVAGQVDPNEMLQNNQASTLLVLLMIAQGAAAMPMAEARYLSAGLTETCRISLFDIVEKDVELSADPIALRCALLFIVLGAWSGDKWLMDIAMGQRGMYMSMLKHAGMLDYQPPVIPVFDHSTSTELQWRSWVQRESQNRLVYNYVMLDQELSLFHDTAPLFAITELQCPLPAPEDLWMASNADEWALRTQSMYGSPPNPMTVQLFAPSLNELFTEFLHDGLTNRKPTLSPQHMRLILHPIQSLLYHLRQMLSCFSETGLTHRNSVRKSVTKPSTLQRLEEVQGLLQTWYEMAMVYHKANPECPVTRCNLVLWHLISLNACTNFQEIERLARREGFDGSFWELSLRRKRCIYQREEAIAHCGQISRHLRAMANDRRPAWWSAAMYRATLILWADSVSRQDPNFQSEKHGSPTAPVVIDQVSLENTALADYMWKASGVAVLTRKDGSHISLDNPSDVLMYAVNNIEDGFSSRLGDGLKRKLIQLDNNWNPERMIASRPVS
ncbi:transcription factor Cmr1 [Immersiella caudata]|uniref:Transcription factor Cmr1 n=1 Tax=Immersiella caudata TaxID=314043 RepID=A0AA39WF35_9PEZI|nr:transcription factor Cmr1 [Immersiella caudata]